MSCKGTYLGIQGQSHKDEGDFVEPVGRWSQPAWLVPWGDVEGMSRLESLVEARPQRTLYARLRSSHKDP